MSYPKGRLGQQCSRRHFAAPHRLFSSPSPHHHLFAAASRCVHLRFGTTSVTIAPPFASFPRFVKLGGNFLCHTPTCPTAPALELVRVVFFQSRYHPSREHHPPRPGFAATTARIWGLQVGQHGFRPLTTASSYFTSRPQFPSLGTWLGAGLRDGKRTEKSIEAAASYLNLYPNGEQ